MESSQVYGGAEECHSSESGWTMYIGSPANDDYEEDELNDDDDNNISGDSYEDDEENSYGNSDDDTDDSMASDASSGPSHWGVNGMAGSKNKEHIMRRNNGYIHKSCSSKYKANNSSSVKKNEEKEESVHGAKGGQAAANSHKERKSIWKGKKGK